MLAIFTHPLFFVCTWAVHRDNAQAHEVVWGRACDHAERNRGTIYNDGGAKGYRIGGALFLGQK